MAGALTFLLVGCLLQGLMCAMFKVIMPWTIEVMKGSCLTIPCSFEIPPNHEKNLNGECKAIWTTDNPRSSDPKLTTAHQTTGDLTKKNCTTTFSETSLHHNNTYFFRLDCDNDLKWSFKETSVTISVKNSPPSPTLTSHTLKMKEGTAESLTCSAPAPCSSHPPTVTWTPGLGGIQETLQENEDKTKVKKSVLNFIASYLHHGEKISCTAVYKKQDGSTEAAVSTTLTADISFPPQILPSSDCTKTESYLSCSCDTVGNPSPTLRWYLDGLLVNQSGDSAIRTEPLNNTGLRSIFAVSQAQERDRSTLLCHSFNSLGSASQQFCVNSQTSAESHDGVLLLAPIITVVTLLVCVLLLLIRAQRNHTDSKLTGETNTVAPSQLLIRQGIEIPNLTEENIYANIDVQRQEVLVHLSTISKPNSITLQSSGPNNAGTASKSSKENDEQSDLVYSSVTWKSKNKKEGCRKVVSNALQMGGLDDKVKPTNVRKEETCEYAQVKFKDKTGIQK